MAHAGQRHVAHIVLIDANCTVLHVVESSQQPGDGGFAAAGSTDDGHRLASTNTQREAAQHRFAACVAEGDVVELHVAAGVDQIDSTGPIDDRRLLVEHLEDATGRRGSALTQDEDEAEEPERRL